MRQQNLGVLVLKIQLNPGKKKGILEKERILERKSIGNICILK